MHEKTVVFGDLHLTWQAGQVILDQAREQGIDKAITLGDEAHKIYPFELGDPEDYRRLYAELLAFRDERPTRTLVCVVGDKTAYVPQDLLPNFIGISPDGKRFSKPYTYHQGNIIAGHSGEIITDEHGHFMGMRREYEPLVIFHGHSHSMGVHSKYRWLKDSEMVSWLSQHKRSVYLKPHHVYWVNPGGNFFVTESGQNVANFAIYDPHEQRVTLQSVFFDKGKIRPRE